MYATRFFALSFTRFDFCSIVALLSLMISSFSCVKLLDLRKEVVKQWKTSKWDGFRSSELDNLFEVWNSDGDLPVQDQETYGNWMSLRIISSIVEKDIIIFIPEGVVTVRYKEKDDETVLERLMDGGNVILENLSSCVFLRLENLYYDLLCPVEKESNKRITRHTVFEPLYPIFRRK